MNECFVHHHITSHHITPADNIQTINLIRYALQASKPAAKHSLARLSAQRQSAQRMFFVLQQHQQTRHRNLSVAAPARFAVSVSDKCGFPEPARPEATTKGSKIQETCET